MLKTTKIANFGGMAWDPNPQVPLPVVIFIPGIGEVEGTGLNQVDLFGPGRQIASGTWKPNFIVVSVQTSKWPSALTVNQIIDAVEAQFNVDSSRIYATGLSHGAKTWLKYAATSQEYADRLAGMFIMSPPTISEWTSGRQYLKNLPIWCVHGTADNITVYAPIKGYFDWFAEQGWSNKKFTTHNSGHTYWSVYFSYSHKDILDGHSAYSWLGLTTNSVDFTTTKTPEPSVPATTSTTTTSSSTTSTTTLAPQIVEQTYIVQAEKFTASKGVRVEVKTNHTNVGFIDLNDWMEYKLLIPTAKAYTVLFRVSSYQTGGSFKVVDAHGNILSTVTVPNTRGWHNYIDVVRDIYLTPTTSFIRIVSTSTARWNLDSFIINPTRNLSVIVPPEPSGILTRLWNHFKNKFGW